MTRRQRLTRNLARVLNVLWTEARTGSPDGLPLRSASLETRRLRRLWAIDYAFPPEPESIGMIARINRLEPALQRRAWTSVLPRRTNARGTSVRAAA